MTLIEILVMTAAALILVAVIWLLFSGGMRHYRSTDEKLKGVQGAQLLVEHLQDDLARLCWDNEHPILAAGQQGPASEAEVTFHVFAREKIPAKLSPTPLAETVNYRFDPESRRIFRNDELLTFAKFESVRFKFQAATSKDPTNPKAALKPNCLLYSISAASEEKLLEMDRNGQQGDGKTPDRRGITTLLGSVPIGNKVAVDQYPGWVENGPDMPLDK